MAAGRYQKVRRGDDLFVWDMTMKKLYKLDEGLEGYVHVAGSLEALERAGYCEDIGAESDFPKPGVVRG